MSAGKELDLSQNGGSQANNMVGSKCIKDAFKRVVMYWPSKLSEFRKDGGRRLKDGEQ